MPGGKICAVAICKSNSKKSKDTGEHIMFFNFPKDPHLREEWVKKCYRTDKFAPENKRVCSKHFKIKDYEDAIKAKVMNYHPKKLKKTAIPSLHLLPADAEKKKFKKLPRQEGNRQKKTKLLVQTSCETARESELKNEFAAQHMNRNADGIDEISEIPCSSR